MTETFLNDVVNETVEALEGMPHTEPNKHILYDEVLKRLNMCSTTYSQYDKAVDRINLAYKVNSETKNYFEMESEK